MVVQETSVENWGKKFTLGDGEYLCVKSPHMNISNQYDFIKHLKDTSTSTSINIYMLEDMPWL